MAQTFQTYTGVPPQVPTVTPGSPATTGTAPWQIPGMTFPAGAGAQLPNILQIATNFPAALSAMTPSASSAASGINTANQLDLLRQIGVVLPTGLSSLQTLGRQAGSMLEGVIPEDVQRAIMDSSAGKALMLGVSGSPAATYDEARTLGLTSLDLINRGAGLFGQATDLARRGYMPQQMTADMLLPGVADVYNNQLQQALANIQMKMAQDALAAGQRGIDQAAGIRFPGSINYDPGSWSGLRPGGTPDFMSQPWGAGTPADYLGNTFGTAPSGGGLANLGVSTGLPDYSGTRVDSSYDPFNFLGTGYGPFAPEFGGYGWGPGVGQSGFFGAGSDIFDPFADFGGMDYTAGFDDYVYFGE